MTVNDEIYIEARPDVVWAVTEDIDRWPDWTPTVTSVVRVDDSPFALGSVARVKQPGQPESEWKVSQFERGKQFEWETRRPGLRMRALHELSAEGAGTANVLRLEMTGLVAVLLWPVLRRAVRRSLSQENCGLKAHCEALAASEVYS
jgi:uncharacterized membrane protein